VGLGDGEGDGIVVAGGTVGDGAGDVAVALEDRAVDGPSYPMAAPAIITEKSTAPTRVVTRSSTGDCFGIAQSHKQDVFRVVILGYPPERPHHLCKSYEVPSWPPKALPA
jgi:hypothetical protein